MKRAKAIDKIMADLRLPSEYEVFVCEKYGTLTGSADSIDITTLQMLEDIIKQSLAI